MNKLSKFFHELLNPHCLHCSAMREELFHTELENKRCRSCEFLERQLTVLNETNRLLTDKLINPVQPAPQPIEDKPAARPIHRGAIPFSMIRQSLELESQARANALKNAARPDSSIDTIKLENEVLNATVSRAAETGTKQ